jgi:[acyl-carrier-protein] S-malonyltransferase
MSARLLLLCPGQGGQCESMFDLARTNPHAAGFISRHALSAGSLDMFENRLAQPLIVTATLAMWEALRPHIPAPALVAGYSIGELAAHAVAGALDADQAVELAGVRAALMDKAALEHPGQALAAVGGIGIERLRSLAARHGVDVAIVTGEDSGIVGGERAGVDALAPDVMAQGGRFQLLPVGVASHTPLMAPAVPWFAARLDGASFAPYACPVLSGVDASRIRGKSAAVEHLSRQLAETIEWSACMDAALESGVTVALELGPGAALSRMLRSRYPAIPCRSVSEFRSLDGIVAWLGRQDA